jgi:PAS domain S-box-containing protein
MPTQLHRSFTAQWGILGLALLLLGGALGRHLYVSHADVIALERDRLLTQARVVEENLAMQLAGAAQLLDYIISRLSKLPKEQQYSSATNELLTVLETATQGVRTFTIVDATGFIQASNRPELLGVDVRHRDYFLVAQRMHAPNAIYLSLPFKTLLGTWTMNLTTCISDERGHFAGAVTASLDPVFFKTLMNSVNYAPDMWTSIAHGQGIVFMMAPEREGQSGKNLAHPGSFFTRHMQGGQKESMLSGKVYATGEERLMAQVTISLPNQRLDNPLVAAVGRGRNEVTAAWRKNALFQSATYALITGLSVLGLNIMHRRQRRHYQEVEHAEAKRRESSERLKLAAEAAGIGIWEYSPDTGKLQWNESMFPLFGLDPNDFHSRYEDWRSAVLPEDLSYVEPELQEALEGRKTFDSRFRIRKSDGEIRVIRGVGRLYRDKLGQVTRMIGINEDVTERVRAEEALRQREQDLQSILNNIPSLIGYWDRDLRNRFGNEAHRRWYGIETEKMQGKHMLELLGEELFKRNLPYFQAALRGESNTFESVTPARANSEVKNTLVNYIPDIQDGEVKGCYVLISDITPVKQAQEALRKREELFRNLFEKSSEAQLLLDDGRFSDCNAAAVRMLRARSKRVVVDKTPDAISPALQPDGRSSVEKIQEVLAATYASGAHRFEWTHLRADGDQFLAEILLTSIPLAGRRMVHVAWRDITASKQIEENQARLAAIVEFSEEPIIGLGLDGVVASWNPAAKRLFGYTAAEIVGQPLTRLYPPDRTREEPELLTRVAKGETFSHFETVRRNKLGDQIDVSISLAPIRDHTQQVVGASMVVYDISEQKRTNAELQRAKEAAEAAARAKSSFLANMSHEIRTPMNAVMGLTQLALGAEISPKQRDYLSKIKTSSAALLNIINDILDYSKIEAGKLSMERVLFNLEETLRNVSNLFASMVEEKALELRFEVAPNVPLHLLGDSLRLGQALNNLVGNAIKFTNQGGVRVRVEAIRQDRFQAELLFAIEDTGIGMSKAQIERLFQPFSQADDSITRRYGGAGLGLTITQRLVELMRGEIHVSSEEGRGSVFSFTSSFGLPQDQFNGLREPLLLGVRALVVDEQSATLLLLRGMLESWSARVTALSSAAEVLPELEAAAQAGDPYHLALLEWELGEEDGLELARRIRQTVDQGRLQPLGLAIMSRRDQDVLAHYAGEGLLDGVLGKPVEQPKLLALALRLRSTFSAPTSALELGTLSAFELARPIHGARILLVEDNFLNQEVAREHLERAGLKVVIAHNGAQGVAMVQRERFDAVLMDLQMPEMDGFEATRRIRALPEGKDLPVIAMTAAALQSDKQACAEAGMNAHVAKPIAYRELIAVLLRWIPQPLAAADSERTGAPSAPEPPPPDESVLDALTQALSENDFTALELFAGLRPGLEAWRGPGPISSLASTIQAFRFSEALDLLGKMRRG